MCSVLTRLRMGMATPHTLGSLSPRGPAESPTGGSVWPGMPKMPSAHDAHVMVKGSKKPVADAEDTSVTCSRPPVIWNGARPDSAG